MHDPRIIEGVRHNLFPDERLVPQFKRHAANGRFLLVVLGIICVILVRCSSRELIDFRLIAALGFLLVLVGAGIHNAFTISKTIQTTHQRVFCRGTGVWLNDPWT